MIPPPSCVNGSPCQDGGFRADLNSGPLHWRRVYEGPFALSAIAGYSAQSAAAVGDTGGVVLWDGNVWSFYEGSRMPTIRLNAVWMRSATELWAAGEQGTVLSVIGGQPTAYTTSRFTNWAITGRYAFKYPETWVGSEDSMPLYVEHNGFSNPGVSLPVIYAAYATPTTMIFAGAGGHISRIGLTQNTTTDDRVTGAGTSTFRGVWAASDAQAWAVGTGGMVAASSGTSWSAAVAIDGAEFRAVSGSSPTDIWAVGLGGLVAHYDGTRWSQMPAGDGAGADLAGIWAADANNIWACGDDHGLGVILRY